MSAPEPRRPARRRWIRRAVLAVLVLAGVAVAADALVNSQDELTAAADTLTSPLWGWVGVAVVAELVSYAARGGATVVVLRRGRAAHGAGAATPGTAVTSAATLAGDAAAYCLPFGFAASGVVTVRILGRRGVPAALATWTFTIAQMFYVGSVAALTLVAIEVAGDRDPVPGLSAAASGLVAGLSGVGLLVAAVRRWEPLRGRYRRWRMRRRRREATARLRGAPGPGARSLRAVALWWRGQLDQLRSARMSAGAAAATFALMTLSWLTDVAVLGVAYAALGTSPPWLGLLLAYCAGQGAAALPVTPGGIGAVEGSLTLALLAFGGTETTTLAAVLLYRLIAYWGCIPLGALAWLALRLTASSSRPASAPSPAALEAEPA